MVFLRPTILEDGDGEGSGEGDVDELGVLRTEMRLAGRAVVEVFRPVEEPLIILWMRDGGVGWRKLYKYREAGVM